MGWLRDKLGEATGRRREAAREREAIKTARAHDVRRRAMTLEATCVLRRTPSEIPGLPLGFTYRLKIDPDGLSVGKDREALLSISWGEVQEVEIADTSWSREQTEHRTARQPFGGPIESIYKRMPVARTKTRTIGVAQAEMVVTTSAGEFVFYVPNLPSGELEGRVGFNRTNYAPST